MKELKYSYESLQKFCGENGIELCKDYSGETVKQDTKIEGKCKSNNCLNGFIKKFVSLITYGGYCKTCSNKIRYEKIKSTCFKKYGVENPFLNENIKQKIRDTNIYKYGTETYSASEIGKIHMKKIVNDKYGVGNISQLNDIKLKKQETTYKNYGVYYPCQHISIKEKIIETNNKNYGVNYGFQSNIIKEKIKNTCLTNYGVEFIGQSLQQQHNTKITNINNYGVPFPMQNEDIKIKMTETCIKKYGVKNPIQNSEIAEKASNNSYQTKIYTFLSGNTIKYQGYEHFALDELIKYINESDIVNLKKDVPNIWYQTADGIKHRHYVDIFIPTQNLCIEVKSEWTAKNGEHNIFLKQQAAKDLGYKYEIWIYNQKGDKIICYD